MCVSIQSRNGAVATTGEWIGAVSAAVPLPRDTPLGSTQKVRELGLARPSSNAAAVAEPAH
ncbi:hypothetical protein [Paraburkholderia lacunae]|uniref:hypothetical protein n=1 Tax=Paraburkholderia lacunae TaxID=2211104 RepID=UPI001059173F|nr:hypothetical protein [Paraburkholderia lacunae]